MSQQKMDEFHRLVREERYREARGILETADDLDPRTVEKWQHWLADLHREDRVLAGVQSDKAEPQKAVADALQLLMGSVAALIAAAITVVLVYSAFTTPGPLPIFPIFLYSLVAGWFGWTWLARSISPHNSHFFGSMIIGVLMFALFFTGIPFGYYSPGHLPLDILLAGVAMSLPFNVRMAWLGGERLGKLIGDLFGDERKDK